MQVTVDVDGKEQTVDVSLDSLTLQESCDVEDALGADGFKRYQDGNITPKVIRALLWAKLRRSHDVSLEDFDIDFGEVAEAEGAEAGPFDNP
jgi:hypothetical protein